MLVAEDEDGGQQRLLQVVSQLLHAAHGLGLLDDDNLVFGHHRIAFGRVDDGRYIIYIAPIHHRLVELFFLIGQYVLLDVVGYQVDVVIFFAHQIVDGAVLLGPKFLQNVVARQFLLCHSLTSRTSGVLRSSFRR